MNALYVCNCGCNVMFKINSNERGLLIHLNPLSYLLQDKLVNDSWSNYIGNIRTWGELKNTIIYNNKWLYTITTRLIF